jgi:hypothetical protein
MVLALAGLASAPAFADPLPDGRLPSGFIEQLIRDLDDGDGDQDHVVGEHLCARPE